MFYFIVAGLFGLLVNVLVDVFSRGNTWKAQIGHSILSGVLIIGASWLLSRTNASGWFAHIAMAFIGFAASYGITWLNKRVGR